MKKLIVSVLCAGMILSLFIPVNAFDIFYQNTPSPVISRFEYTDVGESCFSLSFTSGLRDTELIREATYDAVADFVGSEDKLLASQYRYLAFKTQNHCQVSVDGNTWYTIAHTENAEGTFTLNYHSDILKTLIINGADLSECTDGADFSIRIITASENFNEKNETAVFAYAESVPVVFTGKAFAYIYFILPSDAVFASEALRIFSDPLNEDIQLYPSDGENKNTYIPSRDGYTFDGWSCDGVKRVGVIPANSSAVKLTSHWIPMVYEINYVLTTRFGYPFGRADNSDNPTEYTVGTAAPIYDIVPPVAGFVFDGWYFTEDFSGAKVTEITAGSTGDKVLYAKWVSADEIAAELRAIREKYIKENKFGDIDDDGKVTAADARLVLRAGVGLENFESNVLRRVDYNNSGRISANNARTTLRISVGLDDLYDILLNNGMLDSIK